MVSGCFVINHERDDESLFQIRNDNGKNPLNVGGNECVHRGATSARRDRPRWDGQQVEGMQLGADYDGTAGVAYAGPGGARWSCDVGADCVTGEIGG